MNESYLYLPALSLPGFFEENSASRIVTRDLWTAVVTTNLNRRWPMTTTTMLTRWREIEEWRSASFAVERNLLPTIAAPKPQTNENPLVGSPCWWLPRKYRLLSITVVAPQKTITPKAGETGVNNKNSDDRHCRWRRPRWWMMGI